MRLTEATLDPHGDRWRLTFNVGILYEANKTVVVDNSTGKVVGFD